jgi:hypothetical protein
VHLVLWHLADRWGSTEEHGAFLPLKLSRLALADLACSTRESVSRGDPGCVIVVTRKTKMRVCTEGEGCSAWKRVT